MNDKFTPLTPSDRVIRAGFLSNYLQLSTMPLGNYIIAHAQAQARSRIRCFDGKERLESRLPEM